MNDIAAPLTIHPLTALHNNQHQLAYQQTIKDRQRQFWLGCWVVAALLLLSAWVAEVAPLKLWEHVGRFTSYIDRIFHLDNQALVWTDPAEWFWGWKKWLLLMGETLLMAYVGTVLGLMGALAFCFLASHNLTTQRMWVFFSRRFLEFARTVPEMVFALVFVIAFGLGPLPGVLALSIHSMGALGKLFAEVVENIDMKAVQGVQASGGNWLQKIRFAVFPQVASNFASYTLLRFESNVRGAAVLGFVGAGGIGQTLLESIRKFYYADVSALLVLIILTVMLIDTSTDWVRRSLMGLQVSRP